MKALLIAAIVATSTLYAQPIIINNATPAVSLTTQIGDATMTFNGPEAVEQLMIIDKQAKREVDAFAYRVIKDIEYQHWMSNRAKVSKELSRKMFVAPPAEERAAALKTGEEWLRQQRAIRLRQQTHQN